MRTWTVRDSLETYQVANWGAGFFDIDDRGHVRVTPHGPDGPGVDLFQLVEELDVTRDPNRHLAFGVGMHYCLGAPLARMEGAIAINALLARFPNLQLAIPPTAVRWRPSIANFRGLMELPVRTAARKRNPSGSSLWRLPRPAAMLS